MDCLPGRITKRCGQAMFNLFIYTLWSISLHLNANRALSSEFHDWMSSCHLYQIWLYLSCILSFLQLWGFTHSSQYLLWHKIETLFSSQVVSLKIFMVLFFILFLFSCPPFWSRRALILHVMTYQPPPGSQFVWSMYVIACCPFEVWAVLWAMWQLNVWKRERWGKSDIELLTHYLMFMYWCISILSI